MRRLATLACLVLLAACGRDAAPVTDPPPRDGFLTCGGDDAFPPSVLTGPTDAEDADHGAAAALRAFIADPQGAEPGSPDGWRAAVLTDDEALFLQGEPPKPWSVSFERTDRGWQWRGSGGCQLAPFREGLLAAVWGPEAPVPATARSFTAMVYELACHGFDSSEERIRPPEIEFRADRIEIAFFTEPPGGAQTCPGPPPTPYEVRLDEPVGDRTLYDAGTYPPEIATVGRDPYSPD